MTEIEKLKKLKKMFSVLLIFIDKYALHKNHNGIIWHNIVSDVIGYINYSFSNNLDTHNTILIINCMTNGLFESHQDSLSDFFIVIEDKKKQKKINEKFFEIQTILSDILGDYYFETRKKVNYDVKNNKYIIKN